MSAHHVIRVIHADSDEKAGELLISGAS